MAAPKTKRKFFVYVIKNDATPVYVGKGCGARHKASARKHGGLPEILEWCETEDEAFERERHWIQELQPQNNICKGGNGGRVAPRSKWEVPPQYKDQITKTEWRKAVREFEKTIAKIEEVGPRAYSARLLLHKIDERNCEQFGMSKIDISRLREVAHGC